MKDTAEKDLKIVQTILYDKVLGKIKDKNWHQRHGISLLKPIFRWFYN